MWCMLQAHVVRAASTTCALCKHMTGRWAAGHAIVVACARHCCCRPAILGHAMTPAVSHKAEARVSTRANFCVISACMQCSDVAAGSVLAPARAALGQRPDPIMPSGHSRVWYFAQQAPPSGLLHGCCSTSSLWLWMARHGHCLSSCQLVLPG